MAGIAMIKVVIFDIGGVVTHDEFGQLYVNFAERIGLDSAIVEEYQTQNSDQLSKGEIPQTEFWAYLTKMGAPKDVDYERIWIEESLKIRTVDPEMIALIGNLRKKYKVGTLTNLTEGRYLMDIAMNLYSNFDFDALSFKEHMMKPEKEFYILALRKAGVAPAETVFIDDQEKCMPPARELGIQTILFRDPGQCSQELRALGIEF